MAAVKILVAVSIGFFCSSFSVAFNFSCDAIKISEVIGCQITIKTDIYGDAVKVYKIQLTKGVQCVKMLGNKGVAGAWRSKSTY